MQSNCQSTAWGVSSVRDRNISLGFGEICCQIKDVYLISRFVAEVFTPLHSLLPGGYLSPTGGEALKLSPFPTRELGAPIKFGYAEFNGD